MAPLRRLPRWSQPTAVALGLAVMSWPLVALTFGAVNTSFPPDAEIPAPALGQWSAAASAVFISALVAGTTGAPVVRRHAGIGAALTFSIALVVAVSALPLLPALLGQRVGAGCMSGVFGGTACGSYAVNTDDLIASVRADAFILFAPLIEPTPTMILALGVAIWAKIVRRMRRVSHLPSIQTRTWFRCLRLIHLS